MEWKAHTLKRSAAVLLFHFFVGRLAAYCPISALTRQVGTGGILSGLPTIRRSGSGRTLQGVTLLGDEESRSAVKEQSVHPAVLGQRTCEAQLHDRNVLYAAWFQLVSDSR